MPKNSVAVAAAAAAAGGFERESAIGLKSVTVEGREGEAPQLRYSNRNFAKNAYARARGWAVLALSLPPSLPRSAL